MYGNKKIITPENSGIYRQLEKLDHINVIKVFSCEEKDGHFLAEEEVFDSQTMAAVLQGQEITGDIFYDWLLQICDALEYLYAVKPAITGVSLQPEDILIGEDNLLKLVGFSEAGNTLSKEDVQLQDAARMIALMKKAEGKFMKKYVSLIEDIENGKEVSTISEFRKEIIEAYASRLGIKRAAWAGAIFVMLLVFRLIRKLF